MKELSFDLQEFRETASVVKKMQDEFCELVVEKIRKTDLFEGKYVRRPTGAGSGKVEEDVFFSKVDVAGISVDLEMGLDWNISLHCYDLKSLEITCNELDHYQAIIDTTRLNDFEIFYRKENRNHKYRVCA